MIKAVFFDLDDTLVPTTWADREALARVGTMLLKKGTSHDCCKARAAIDSFREALRVSPWDPEGMVDPDTWRERLWLQSLAKEYHHVCENGRKQDASLSAGQDDDVCENVRKQDVSLSAGQDDVDESGQNQDHPVSLQRLAHECWSLWSSARLENCRMSKATVDALRLLRQEKDQIRLGVITNGSASVQRQKLAACGVGSLVDVIFIGDDVESCLEKTKQALGGGGGDDVIVDVRIANGGEDSKGNQVTGEEEGKVDGVISRQCTASLTPIYIQKAKPCASIFSAACAAVGCSPKEAVMVGDSLEMDIRGAENAGFASAVLVTEGKDKEGGGEDRKMQQRQSSAGCADDEASQGDGATDDNSNRNANATGDEDDGCKSTCCTAPADTQIDAYGGHEHKTLFLQCTRVSHVPNLLRQLPLS